VLNALSITSTIQGNISLMDNITFNYKLTIEGEGLNKLIDSLGLHSFTLGQSIDNAEELVLQRSYSFKVNKEVLMKFINLQKDQNADLESLTRITGNKDFIDELYIKGDSDSETNGDALYQEFLSTSGTMGTINGLITNVIEVQNEDYILYDNGDNAYKKPLKKIGSITPTEEDSEILMIKNLILFINIKDDKTLTLESFKKFINENKSDIINKIITETSLGADYRGRGKDPHGVLRNIRGRKLM